MPMPTPAPAPAPMPCLRLLAAALALGAAALVPPAAAQGKDASHDHHGAAAPAAAGAPLVEGEVRKVDKAKGRITLQHGPLAHLGMGAMTMAFKVADPELLDGVKAGDKVRFAAVQHEGALTVTALQPVR